MIYKVVRRFGDDLFSCMMASLHPGFIVEYRQGLWTEPHSGRLFAFTDEASIVDFLVGMTPDKLSDSVASVACMLGGNDYEIWTATAKNEQPATAILGLKSMKKREYLNFFWEGKYRNLWIEAPRGSVTCSALRLDTRVSPEELIERWRISAY